MAVATEELVNGETSVKTQDNGSETEETSKAKRERIDIDKVAAENPHEKILMSVGVPAEMRVMIRQKAETLKVPEIQYVRNLIAMDLGYEVPASFNERARRSGALSEDEKAKITQDKRNTVNEVLATVQANEEAKALLASLGIDITKLPKPRGPKNKNGKHDDE